MENLSTAGMVAIGAIVGACATAVLERKRKEESEIYRESGRIRMQKCRDRKREEESQREEERLRRQTVLKRQSRSRAKRHLTLYRDRHLDTYMLWHIEDLTCLYDLVRVQNALQCLAWYLDISYDGDIPWITDLNFRLKSWTHTKSKAYKTWFWNNSRLLLTQKVKLFDGEIVTVLDSLHLASKHYPDDKYIAHDIVYVVHMIALQVIEMELGFIYHKHGFNISNAEQAKLWNTLTEGDFNLLSYDFNTFTTLSPREICVQWKVSILERIQKEFSSHFTNFALSDWADEDEKYLACSIQREIFHYLYVTQFHDVVGGNVGGMIWCEDTVHLSKKENRRGEWVSSNVVREVESNFEERGRFRKCTNDELLRNRIILKGHVKKSC